jgi:hypothetical protein
MRGKKADPNFVSDFIERAIVSGFQTPEAIVNYAKTLVQGIDDQIKEVEKQKVIRSKLLDVISSFEKPTTNKLEESKLLPFFKLEYPGMCKFICDIVKKTPIEIGEKMQAIGSGENDPTMKFSIKQLLECKVLNRAGNRVSRGDRFDEYMKFVLRE